MKLTEEELARHKNPYFRRFINTLNELIGEHWNIQFRVHNPQLGDKENTHGIDKQTALILWGDEYSQIFPHQYYNSAGVIIKPYCPEPWIEKGIIPMTDNAMIYANENQPIIPCSRRPYTIMYSANLNYRRTDLYRALSGQSLGYPFRISSNYPTTGKYPLFHKLEAVLAHKLITLTNKQTDFSHLYPNSYIKFHNGFMQGSLSAEEYNSRLHHSKISWCTAGYMTNETSRLIESACAGCAIICGKLPDSPIYAGHPFQVTHDWRNIRKITDELLNDSDKLDEMGQASRNWYNTHFSPEAQAHRIAKVLNER